jgi:phosphatidylserine/phosphatidylglycerophosphate/cardiolipin synthase-like enzyme
MISPAALPPLSDTELELLSEALASHRLGAASDRAAVVRAGLGRSAEAIAGWLAQANGQFGQGANLAAIVDMIRAERRRGRRAEPSPELVLTGPGVGAGCAAGRDTPVVVREMFESARSSVLIVGYAFHRSEPIFAPLADRMGGDARLRVRMVVNVPPKYGRNPAQTLVDYAHEFTREVWPFHPRPEVYYLPASLDDRGPTRTSIHAKLVVVDESTLFLGSANFTEAAFERNLEAGVRTRNLEIAGRFTAYVDRLIAEGVLTKLPV